MRHYLVLHESIVLIQFRNLLSCVHFDKLHEGLSVPWHLQHPHYWHAERDHEAILFVHWQPTNESKHKMITHVPFSNYIHIPEKLFSTWLYYCQHFHKEKLCIILRQALNNTIICLGILITSFDSWWHWTHGSFVLHVRWQKLKKHDSPNSSFILRISW